MGRSDSDTTKGTLIKDTGSGAFVTTSPTVTNDDDCDILDGDNKTTKMCGGCRLPPWRLIVTIAACVLIEASLGVTYTFGNMMPYLTSYVRNVTAETSVGYGQMIWVYNSGWLTGATCIPLMGLLEPRMNGRLYFFLGICVNAGSFFGSYWAVQASFLFLILTYGVLQGVAQAVLYPVCVSVALRWFPRNKGLVGGITMSGYGGGAFIWNQVVTKWINPDNLQPDLALGEDLYFTQRGLLDRVPTCFLLLGGILTALQLLCLVSLSFPPSNHGKDLLLGTTEIVIEPNAEGTEKPLLGANEIDVEAGTEDTRRPLLGTNEINTEADTDDVERPLLCADKTDVEEGSKNGESPVMGGTDSDIQTGFGDIKSPAPGTVEILVDAGTGDSYIIALGTSETKVEPSSEDASYLPQGTPEAVANNAETEENDSLPVEATKPDVEASMEDSDLGVSMILTAADIDENPSPLNMDRLLERVETEKAIHVVSESLYSQNCPDHSQRVTEENADIKAEPLHGDDLDQTELKTEAATGEMYLANPSDPTETKPEADSDDTSKSPHSENISDPAETKPEADNDDTSKSPHSENISDPTETKPEADSDDTSKSPHSENISDPAETKPEADDDDTSKSPHSENISDPAEARNCEVRKTDNHNVCHVYDVTADTRLVPSVVPKTIGVTTPTAVIPGNRRNSGSLNYSPLQVLTSGIVWILWLNNLTIDLGGIFIITFYKAYGQTFVKNDHLLSLVASFAAVFNAAGRPVWGLIADRIGFFPTLLVAEIILVVTSGTFMTCELSGSSAMFFVWVCAMFTAFSGIFALVPALTSALFGNRYFIFNLGVVHSTAVISCLGSVPLAETLLGTFGWKAVFLVASGTLACGVAVLFSTLALCSHRMAIPSRHRFSLLSARKRNTSHLIQSDRFPQQAEFAHLSDQK